MRTIALHDKLALARFYMAHFAEIDTDIKRQIYLSESIKQALACRYSGMFGSNGSEKCECGTLLEQCRRAMKESNVLSKKETLVFNAFIRIPTLYRLFRIMDDPTLLYWEKSEREKKKNTKQ